MVPDLAQEPAVAEKNYSPTKIVLTIENKTVHPDDPIWELEIKGMHEPKNRNPVIFFAQSNSFRLTSLEGCLLAIPEIVKIQNDEAHAAINKQS